LVQVCEAVASDPISPKPQGKQLAEREAAAKKFAGQAVQKVCPGKG
jgi:hypothetical protein